MKVFITVSLNLCENSFHHHFVNIFSYLDHCTVKYRSNIDAHNLIIFLLTLEVLKIDIIIFFKSNLPKKIHYEPYRFTFEKFHCYSFQIKADFIVKY